MINIIIVSDDHDKRIGSNCQLAYEHLKSNVDLTNFNTHLLSGENCQPINVQDTIASFQESQQQKFILVAFSHGTADALISTYAPEGYINSSNSYFFGTSLIYTNSCFTGLSLMQSLIDNNCHGYVGYTGSVKLPESTEDQLVFIACENSGLIEFINSNNTLTNSISYMKSYYEVRIEEYFDNDMGITASLLEGNLKQLVFHDCGPLDKQSFE